MGTGVASQDRTQPMARQFGSHLWVADQSIKIGSHIISITRNQEVLSGCEQALRIVPRRANQGDATGEGFKDSYGRNAWKRLDIWPARNMHGGSKLSKDLRYSIIGNPPTVLNVRFLERLQRFARIAHAIHLRVQLEPANRRQEELLQFHAAFAVAPVSNPHQIALSTGGGAGMK